MAKKMASKVKTLTEVSNKTARKNQQKGKAKDQAFIPSPDVTRIIPLNGGQHAYVLDPRNGRTHHVKVDSPEYESLLVELGLEPLTTKEKGEE